MITSSTITIAVVKIYKCMRKKKKMNKAKITDIDLEDPNKRVDKDKFFKTMLPNE